MNFKSTLLLIIALGIIGLFLILSRDQGDKPAPSPTEETLLKTEAKDISKLSIASDDRTLAFERSGEEWKMTSPVASAVEKFEIESLVSALANLKSKGPTEKTDANLKTTGLDKPRYTIDLGGKVGRLLVGSRAAVGNSVYVMVEGGKSIETVDTSLLEKLDKDPATYRKAQLVTMPSRDIKQVQINRPDGKLVLEKSGESWKVTSPTTMPADTSAVTDMLFAITGLRATEWVSDNAADAKMFQVGDNAKTSVWVSTDAPTTQPASTQPVGTTVTLGRYDSIEKKDVYAMVAGSGSIVKVSASLLTHLNKKPLELRDKALVQIDPEQVSQMTIHVDKPATTQPILQSATNTTTTIARRKQTLSMGPAMPTATSQPGTQPSSQPASQPALTKWQVDGADADDEAVAGLLREFAPLNVSQFVDSIPLVLTSTKGQISIELRTESAGGASVANHRIVLTDYGQGENVYGNYGGTLFQIPRTLFTRLEGKFVKKAQP